MDFGLVAVRRVAAPAAFVAVHQVDAQAGVGAEALVEVEGDFLVALGADAGGGLVLVDGERRLGHLVDHAAGLAASEEHGAGAAQDVDLLGVEGFAVVLGGVADAVEVHVAEGVEAAQHHVVARTPAFRGVEGDAGDVAQRFAQRADLLFFHQIVGDRRHRLRNVVRVLQHLADAGLGGEVAVRFGFGLPGDDDRRQGLVGAGGLGCRLSLLRGGAQGYGHHRRGERQQARRGAFGRLRRRLRVIFPLRLFMVAHEDSPCGGETWLAFGWLGVGGREGVGLGFPDAQMRLRRRRRIRVRRT